MECPHCRAEITATPHTFALGMDQDGTWKVSNIRCPTCDHLVVSLLGEQGATYPVLPQGACRAGLSTDVPQEWADDYHTACRVLPHSPEASAALSRRALHKLLAVKTGAGHGILSDQIRQAVISSDLPPYLKQALQTLTRIAKLEPDSPKSERPEALAPAEPGEAEWLLDILQAMFDLYFVLPAKMERRQASLEQIIAQPEAGATAQAEATTQTAAVAQAGATQTAAATQPGATVPGASSAADATAGAGAAQTPPVAPDGGPSGSVSV